MPNENLKFFQSFLFIIMFFVVFSDAKLAFAISGEDCDEIQSGNVSLKGKLSFKTVEGSVVEAGRYWTVRIYGKNAKNEVEEICFTQTRVGGVWSASFKADKPDRATKLEVAVFSENNYIAVTTKPGNAHEVTRECNVSIPNNSQRPQTIHLIADLSPNCANSSIPPIGVGEVMAAASKFRKKISKHEIDVKSKDRHGYDRQVRVYFPNTWYNCGDGTTVPGTCASSSDRAEIWIAGSDIVLSEKLTGYRTLIRNLTVMHELAHQLHSDKWKYNWPPPSKSPVGPSPCREETDALTEGFASAMAAWIYYGEQETNPMMVWLDTNGDPAENNIEKPKYGHRCVQGHQDSKLVAALFWDLLDHNNDVPLPRHTGQDVWYFKDPSTPFKIFLEPPEQNGRLLVWKNINDLREAFKHNLSQTNKVHIDEIYDNNMMPE